ncbi:hypothetical protein V6X63_10155 [Spiribacter sp. 221]|uniref:hypothetical protein n=1 Tax=Spiribacter onubensis TaxID=3122420 RepID=UPI00349F5039
MSRTIRRPGALAAAAVAGAIAITSGVASANTTSVVVEGFRYQIGVETTSNPPDSSDVSSGYAPWFGSLDLARDYAKAAYAAGVGKSDPVYFAYGRAGEINQAVFATSATDTPSTSSGSGEKDFAFVDGAAVEVPEIDGAALAQGALAIAGIGLWFAGRGRAAHARGDTRMGASLSAAPVH